MQGLSPEHPEATEPLHTATPEGTPEDSPHPGEIPLVTLTHMDVSDVPKVFTPPSPVDPTDPLTVFKDKLVSADTDQSPQIHLDLEQTVTEYYSFPRSKVLNGQEKKDDVLTL
jgi:hypothetical protein